MHKKQEMNFSGTRQLFEKKAEFEAGVLLVDKPIWATSFAMVRALRRLLGVKKIGHAGTLDPFASGLLVVCVGRPATRMISHFMDTEKEYLATLLLGRVSTTQDPEGEISGKGPLGVISRDRVEEILGRYKGAILQTPPAYSALKHMGKPLYHYARQGILITKEAREVYIHHLDWLDRRDMVDESNVSLTIRVVCSKGTYIRALAADIGEALGCGAYLTSLRRVRSGFFSVEDSIPGASFGEDTALDLIRASILSVDEVQNLLQ